MKSLAKSVFMAVLLVAALSALSTPAQAQTDQQMCEGLALNYIGTFQWTVECAQTSDPTTVFDRDGNPAFANAIVDRGFDFLGLQDGVWEVYAYWFVTQDVNLTIYYTYTYLFQLILF